jgi:hypothetical protein
LTYPGELVANIGETVVSVLDKIKTALGNFEYFYDLDGKFHFRKIKNFVNSNPAQGETYNSSLDNYF